MSAAQDAERRSLLRISGSGTQRLPSAKAAEHYYLHARGRFSPLINNCVEA
jgi:hypothetical protein